jgi:drug/metabolite transporter (DMT)-like permease
MINYILLGCSVVLAVVKSAFVKKYSSYAPDKNSPIFFFNLLAYGLAAIIQLVINGIPSLSLWIVLPSAGYALSCYLMQIFLMKSMAIGSMALSSLFCMYGMLIPSVAGPLFFSESFSALQGVGVVLMILAIFFSADVRKDNSTTSKEWLIFALLTLLFSGMVGIFEKIHQTGLQRDDIHSFLSCAFTMIALLNAITLPIVRKREENPPPIKHGLLTAILTGLVVVFYNRINLILAGALDTMIYYPISSGGAVLLTLIVSVIVFREPIKRNHILCFVSGTAAILLLGIF